MDTKTAYPLIAPLLRSFELHGVRLSDKAVQALNLAALDAKAQNYRMIYDDNILAGVIRCGGTVTGLLESLGIDPSEVIEKAHLPIAKQDDYRRIFAPSKRGRKLRRKPFTTIGLGGDTHSPVDITNFLARVPPEVTSEDLFLVALKMPAVWAAINRRGFSVNKVLRHGERLRLIEPDIETQKFSISLEGKKYHFDLFDFAAGVQVVSPEPRDGKLWTCRLEIVNPRTHHLTEQVEEFEWLINKVSVSEYDIQRFLEAHPHFLLGIEYKRLHSQLTLVRADKPDLRPDFFLERLEGRWCDILELKLPIKRLLVGPQNRRTFRAAVWSALGQLKEYRSFFDDAANRRAFHAAYGLEAFKPKVQVLIGRSSSFRDFAERRALEEELAHLEILTFDDVLLRAKHQIGLLT